MRRAAPGDDGALEIPIELLGKLRGRSATIAMGAQELREIRAGRSSVLVLLVQCGALNASSASYTGVTFR